LADIHDVSNCIASNTDEGCMLDLFAGLKKVTDDMKTKNRADRSGAVPAGSAPSEKAASTLATPKIGTPKCELDGRKYVSSYLLLSVVDKSLTMSVYILKGLHH
jgi:hypothetical protein